MVQGSDRVRVELADVKSVVAAMVGAAARRRAQRWSASAKA